MTEGRFERAARNAGRYFVASLPAEGERLTLSGDEARHAGSSRRARSGDTVTLFDGTGVDVEARVAEVRRGGLVLEALVRRQVGPPLARPVTCAAALPKGSREDALVAGIAQTGIARFVPLDFERSVARARANWARRHARFQRLAVEAAKQSGASTVLEIADPTDAASFLCECTRGLRLIGAPGAESGFIETLAAQWPFEELTFVIGPEGGLTDGESARAREAGFMPVCFTPTILRIETACVTFAGTAAAFIHERTADRGADPR